MCEANGALLTESQCSKTNGNIFLFSSKIQCLNGIIWQKGWSQYGIFSRCLNS